MSAPKPRRAITAEKPVMLLVDEVDKSDPEFEAFLLEILSDFQVTVPEIGTIHAKTKPLVFLTSNSGSNLRLGFGADMRDYGVGTQILADLGVRKLRIITNNPGKRAGIEGYGLSIVERVPLEITPNENNLEYLRTKKAKLGHVLHLMS